MARTFLIRLLMMVGFGVAVFAALWAYSIWSRTTPEQKLAALEEEVRPKGGKVFRATLMDKPVAFLLLDCAVFLLNVTDDRVERTKVLGTSFYFGLDVCTSQSIGLDGDYLKVHLATQAIGAGGGNTTGGSFRSKDGVTWEKYDGTGWQPVG